MRIGLSDAKHSDYLSGWVALPFCCDYLRIVRVDMGSGVCLCVAVDVQADNLWNISVLVFLYRDLFDGQVVVGVSQKVGSCCGVDLY